METRTESTIGSTGWQGNDDSYPEHGDDGGDEHNVDVDHDREGQQQGEQDGEVMMTKILMTVGFIMIITVFANDDIALMTTLMMIMMLMIRMVLNTMIAMMTMLAGPSQ